MENMIAKVNYDELLSEMAYEDILELQEKIRERRINEFGRKLVFLENENIQLNKKIDSINAELEESARVIKQINEDFVDLTKKTSQITDTLLSHATEKRELENYIHKLVYNCIKKKSLRDELFHGCLTASCKKHIKDSLKVSKFDCIMVEDVTTAKKLASKHLTEHNIHRIMRNDARRLFEQSQISKKDNVKRLGMGKGRKFELLDMLLEEVGGDINAI